jgi:hypothetical protein
MFSDSILSINSGIIEMYADDKVNLVNKIVCPASYVSKTSKMFIEYDFPEPRPPVTM